MPLASRISQLAEFVEVAFRVGGVPAARRSRANATASIRSRSGVIDGCGTPRRSCRASTGRTWDAVIESEPALTVVLSGERFDHALTAIADFVDLKSPYTLGHARAVADLAAAAVRARLVRVRDPHAAARGPGARSRSAGRVELDLGQARAARRRRMGAGPASSHITERMLLPVRTRSLRSARSRSSIASVWTARVPPRADGRRSRVRLGFWGRPTPIKRCASRGRIARRSRARPRRQSCEREARAGRLDADVVEAVLGAAGHRVARRREGPAGLTQREIEVLRLLARGLSNKGIAEQLVISPKTAANHIEHIYTKIDASTRARASLFAMQHGLLPEEEFATDALSG